MYNIKKVTPGFEEDLATNGGMLVMDHTAKTKHFGGTWFDNRAITNVLSYALVRKQVGPNIIGYDAKKDLFGSGWASTILSLREARRVCIITFLSILEKILRAS